MDNKEFILELYNNNQIKFHPEGISWKGTRKNGIVFHTHTDCGRDVVDYPELLEFVAEKLYCLIREIVPQTTHVCGLPNAGLPLAEKIAENHGLEYITYDKAWHANYDLTNDFVNKFADALKNCGVDLLDYFENAYAPHGSYGKLKGKIEKGAKIFRIDNVVTDANSLMESEKILKKVLKYENLELGTDADLVGIGVVQVNSPRAYGALKGKNLGALLTAPETFGTLRQAGFIEDEMWNLILTDLNTLGWFSDIATPERVGDLDIYAMVQRDFEGLNERISI